MFDGSYLRLRCPMRLIQQLRGMTGLSLSSCNGIEDRAPVCLRGSEDTRRFTRTYHKSGEGILQAY